MDFAGFRDADLTAFRDAAGAWRSYADALYDHHDASAALRGVIRSSGWTGEAAVAAYDDAGTVREWFETRAMRADAMADVLEQVHEKLLPLQRDLRATAAGATGEGMTVDEWGGVTASGAAPAERAGRYAAIIAAILGRVEAVSASAVAAAGDIAPAAAGVVDGREYNDIRDDSHEADIADDVVSPNLEMSPGSAASWWASLSPAQQRAYLLAWPEEIGAMDGLPAAVRDRANRWNLRRDIEINAGGDQRILLGKIESRDGLGDSERIYLLKYEAPGEATDGRIIASVGNPDTAAHTGIYVPGMTTDLHSTVASGARDGGLDRTRAMYDQMKRFAGGGDVAMIYWLGYDAPDGLDGLADADARKAAPALDAFADGLATTHTGPPAHTTVAAHSYGTVVTGYAASTGDGLNADDIVLAGSPGMPVATAGELGVGADHVWVAAGDDDIITTLGNAAHGGNPAHAPFGANVLDTDTSGHSDYWEQGSDTLTSIGAILGGHAELAAREPAD